MNVMNPSIKHGPIFDPGNKPSNSGMPRPTNPVIGPPRHRPRSQSPFNMMNYQMMNSKAPASGFGFGGIRRLDGATSQS